MSPPYWSVPLLAPPPIAVVWRLLALLGDSSMVLWWAASITITMAAAVFIACRGSSAALVAACILSPGLAFTAVSGNANSFLLLVLIGVWLLRDRHPLLAGAFVAVAAAVKLSPVLLVVWFVLRGGSAGKRGLAGFVAGGVIVALVSLAGAGIAAHFDYLAALHAPGTGAPSPMSLPVIAVGLGLPGSLEGLVIPSVVALALVLVVAWRHNEKLCFAVLAAAGALATPAVSLSTFALLAVALAPWLSDAHRRMNAPTPTATEARDGSRLQTIGGLSR